MKLSLDGARSVSFRVLALAAVAGFAVLPSQAQDGGKFDGAVWTYGMTPKQRGRGLAPLKGAFRVNDDVIYQKAKPDDPEFSKKVGQNTPRGKKTRIAVDGLRGFDKNRQPHAGLKGVVLLSADRFGEWSGTFIDSEGRHWDFKCTRKQE